jgi:hypothetical protein
MKGDHFMRLPGFTAESSMYLSTQRYVMLPSVASVKGDRVVSIAAAIRPFMAFGGGDGGNGGGFKGVQCTDPDPTCPFGFRGHICDVDGNCRDTGCCIPQTPPPPTPAECLSAANSCLVGACFLPPFVYSCAQSFDCLSNLTLCLNRAGVQTS